MQIAKCQLTETEALSRNDCAARDAMAAPNRCSTADTAARESIAAPAQRSESQGCHSRQHGHPNRPRGGRRAVDTGLKQKIAGIEIFKYGVDQPDDATIP